MSVEARPQNRLHTAVQCAANNDIPDGGILGEGLQDFIDNAHYTPNSPDSRKTKIAPRMIPTAV